MDRGAWRAIVHEEKDPQNFRRLAQSHSMLGRAVRASGFPGGAGGMKNLPANARDTEDVGSVLGLGRSPGEGKGYPPQYSGLENS